MTRPFVVIIWSVLVVCAAFGGSTALASAAAPSAQAINTGYHIRVGDTLTVTVYGEANLTQNLKVLPGGSIVVPLAGQVDIGGLTPTAAARVLEKRLGSYIKHPSVTIAVAETAPLQVLVLGNVKTPGRYDLQPGARVTDALAAAGGLGPTDGNLPVARLGQPDGNVASCDLQKLLHQGELGLNVPLVDETTVYVPSPLVLNVQVLGAVQHPGDVELHEGDRLSMAIARAGASPGSNSDLNHIELRRLGPDGTPTTTSVNLYTVMKSQDPTLDPVLQKNDLVYVPQGRGTKDVVSPIASFLFGLRQLIGIP